MMRLEIETSKYILIMGVLYNLRPEIICGNECQTLISYYLKKTSLSVLQDYAQRVSLEIGKRYSKANIFCCFLTGENSNLKIQIVIPKSENESLRIEIGYDGLEIIYSWEAWSEIAYLSSMFLLNKDDREVTFNDCTITMGQLAAISVARIAGYKRMSMAMLDMALNNEVDLEG